MFMPYATTVYASDLVGNVVKSISFDNIVKMVKSLYKVGYNVATTGSGDGAASSKALDSIWGEDSVVNKWLQTKLFPFMDSSGNIDLTKEDCPISYNNEKQLVEFNPTFTNELNQAVQDQIHAFDGYYLIEPKGKSPQEYAKAYEMKDSEITKFMDYLNNNNFQSTICDYTSRHYFICPPNIYYYIVYNEGAYRGDYELHCYDKNHNSWDCKRYGYWIDGTGQLVLQQYSPPFNSAISSEYLANVLAYGEYSYGLPFKLFYSKEALQNYLANNEKRTFVPQLPSSGFKVNIKYINNSVNYPDINVNLDSLVGKVETDVQADLDLILKNYLDHLADFTDGGGATTPTPTPSGGGSGGDFGDGTTPTPKPDFSDGSLTDTNTLLQKILDKLTELSANHDKLAKTITDYIEKNDGKLEEILIAIQALSDGKTETEQNGCKYDFTVLSKYLTDLWNNSDKKFDEMVKLLEENNKYQQKLVDSLNEIKALLIADTVMDFFKDRSQETAEKAKDKFPTSIPWDISLVLNSMSAEPKNPKFSLPIKIESFKINETIDIDLSTDEWEKLAKTCRYILSVTFILFLIHLSRKLFSNGGDD